MRKLKENFRFHFCVLSNTVLPQRSCYLSCSCVAAAIVSENDQFFCNLSEKRMHFIICFTQLSVFTFLRLYFQFENTEKICDTAKNQVVF